MEHNGIDDSLLLWWPTGKPRAMSWQQLPGTAKLTTADIFGVDWLHVAFVQFFLVGELEVRAIRAQAPHAPLMLGGDRHMHHDDAEGYADLLQPDAPPVPPPPHGMARQRSDAQ